MKNPSNPPGEIRVGTGGWTYAPWRDNFYPAGLPHSQELGYASRQLSAIEVNGTYYSTFKPASFAKWRDEAPDGFVFSLKASRTTGYAPKALDGWADSARMWAEGSEPADLPRVAGPVKGSARTRDVFVFFINGAKERAPAAATALLQRLGFKAPM